MYCFQCFVLSLALHSAEALFSSAGRGKPYHQIKASKAHHKTAEEKMEDGIRKSRSKVGVAASSKLVVWITGYARSGTSTILSMITDASQGSSDNVFGIYEPCDNDDVYDDWLANSGCQKVIEQMGNCEFYSISYLQGWNNTHSQKPGVDDDVAYSAYSATQSCNESSILAYKTIEINAYEVDLDDMFDEIPNMYILSIVRDPRAIYISEKNTFPDLNLGVDRLLEICEGLEANMEIEHDSVYNLKFEHVAKNPSTWMNYTYRLLGLSYGSKQEEWIGKTFNASDDCVECAYCDCHKNTSGAMIAWHSDITSDELAAFKNSSSCVAVADHYEYSLDI